MPQFERYVGIDYSGAETPASSLPGLRVYEADGDMPPKEVSPPLSPRKHWTRRGIAEWLSERLSEGKPMLVGIDHGFSFPRQYFKKYQLPDWPAFLNDFQEHWPTDDAHVYVDFIRNGQYGKGAKRKGDPSWLRLTEQWTASAKSVFKFDIQGQVAKSTHAGLPWLRYLRQRHPEIHFWPFDGWEIPKGRSALVEVYPALWMKRFPVEDLNPHQQAAYCVAAWLQRADRDDSLSRFLNPPLEANERAWAEIEGWILGVT